MWWFLLLAIALPVHADTSIQVGLWEKTESVTMEGSKVPTHRQSVCLKAGEASLERLLLLNDDEVKARGCKSEIAQPREGQRVLSLSCPASEQDPAIDVVADVRFTPTSFQGIGRILIKSKDGQERRGNSVLSGRRMGDC
jgi:hypothetical protein